MRRPSLVQRPRSTLIICFDFVSHARSPQQKKKQKHFYHVVTCIVVVVAGVGVVVVAVNLIALKNVSL